MDGSTFSEWVDPCTKSDPLANGLTLRMDYNRHLFMVLKTEFSVIISAGRTMGHTRSANRIPAGVNPVRPEVAV